MVYDIAILGGGINGAGIARDAALRGLKVLLLEKGDWGSGTSSKSSKLIHGGLRYLENREFGLVFESVNERAVQRKLAPHMVRPLPFLFPVYAHAKPGLEIMNIGLWIYDTLALFRTPSMHRTYRGEDKARDLEPALTKDGLSGAIEYHDCVTDDARLVLENVLDAVALGADCRSYTPMTGLVRDGDGRVRAVKFRDALTGEDGQADCRALIIAAGAWTDEANDELRVGVERDMLRRTKGVHLVFPREQLPLRRAVTCVNPDGRVMFAIPWMHRTVIGTTDTDFEGTADDVHADLSDVRYLCDAGNRYFPDAKFSPEDVIATWAGLRPLLKDPDAKSESDVSREHEIFVRDDGITIIAGGKLTTYRRMAHECVGKTLKWLKRNDDDVKERKLKRAKTGKRPLPGGRGIAPPSMSGVRRLAHELAERIDIDVELADHLAHTYGGRAYEVGELIEGDRNLAHRLQPDLPYLWAEVQYAVTADLARTLRDVLGRRIPLLLVGRDQGLDVVEAVADRVARALSWSPERTEREIAAYRAEVEASRRFRTER